MTRFGVEFIIFVICVLVTAGFKVMAVKRAGKILVKRYFLFNKKIDYLTSLLFAVLMGIIIYLRFIVKEGITVYDFNPVVPLFVFCYLIVYPWNVYLGKRGLVKSRLIPLNSYFLVYIDSDRINDIRINERQEKYELTVEYSSKYQKKIKLLKVKLFKKDYPKLKDWKNRMIEGEGRD